MPDDNHPGFTYWQVNQPGHPFPVGDIQLGVPVPNESGATVYAVLTPPQAQPTLRTVAERSIGFVGSSQFWFALECVTKQGVVTCEAVLRGRHVHWFDGHPGETAPGPTQVIRLSEAEMSGWGQREVLALHGQHCDSFFVTWAVNGASVRCELTVLHVMSTIPELKKARAKKALGAERTPPSTNPLGEVPIIPWPTPTPSPPEPMPVPPPQPGPDNGT